MNYNYSYETDGLTYLDIRRTSEKYPFSMVGTYIKDLEKIAALKKAEHRKTTKNILLTPMAFLKTGQVKFPELYSAIRNSSPRGP